MKSVHVLQTLAGLVLAGLVFQSLAAWDSRSGHGRLSLDGDEDVVLHASDNCPTAYNMDQADADGDGIGNRCEAPVIESFWPQSGLPGDPVLVFGQYFLGESIQLTVNGVAVPQFQKLGEDLLVFMLPGGDTVGPIAVSTEFGDDQTAETFGNGASGVDVSGFWPLVAEDNWQHVVVFGNGFEAGSTQVSLDNNTVPIVTVLDPQMLVFFVPPGAQSSSVQVTTNSGTAASSGELIIQ